MKKFIITLCASLAAAGAFAAEAPLWLRNTAISPDGHTIAFTYKGDVYTVSAAGGRALRITTDPGYDSCPVWSPDGSKIAFFSNRMGSNDIYVVAANGGTPRRVTTHSGSEVPLAWLNDSTVLFAGSVLPDKNDLNAPFSGQTYKVNIKEGSRPEMFLSLDMRAVAVGPDGAILFEDCKGFENAFRKHEQSSGTTDIHLYKDGKFTRISDYKGTDRNPVWLGKDGKSYAYTSERNGALNIYKGQLGSNNLTEVTHYKEAPVRSLSASADGNVLAYSYDGEIYTITGNGQPVKVAVDIVTDDFDGDTVKSFITSGANSLVPSPNDEEVAFTVRGEVYVTNNKYPTTKRITNTPGQERNVSFSDDGRMMVYDSERDGHWALYTARIKNDKEKTFAYATEIVEEPLYSAAGQAQQPEFSPDGKKVAFLEDRTTLRVIDVKSKEVKTVLDGKYNYSYTDGDVSFTWSPDSKWLLASYIGVGGWNNSDIALVAADGSQVVDLTESGYSDGAPRWALDGKAITYLSGRYGMKSHGSWGNQSDVLLMILDGETFDRFHMNEEDAALAEKEEKGYDEDDESVSEKDKEKADKKAEKAKEKKDKKFKFDLANRRYRTERLTGSSSNMLDYYLSSKGDKLYYVAASTEGGWNLYERDMRKGNTKVLSGGISSGLTPDKKGDNLYVFAHGNLAKVNLGSGSVETIEFNAPYDRQPSLEREYIYDHVWQQVKDKFYDKNLHGVDWEGYGKAYRKFLPYINNNLDFGIMLSELLGELNASHTGASGRLGGGAMQTATLCAFYDPSYTGKGLRIDSIMPRSPLSAAKADVKAGDIILAIDGVEIEPGKDYYPLLAGKAGRKTRITVEHDGKQRTVEVRPASAGFERGLRYDMWVERNEKLVDSLSGGRIGYVHIQGMNNESFQTVYSRLLGKYRNCDAVVVDTRFNGGGWLHNDVALLLSGKEYVRYSPRGQYIGSDPFSQWTKPSVMLVNEANYSDAHGTPYTYNTLGIGKLVGAPVPGTMTAVWWETQIDPAIVFGIPQVTSLDRNGEPLENKQLNPDIEVYNTPAEKVSGNDLQLKKAVEELMKTI